MARRGPTELGERLKRLAHAAGFTAETLAERLGCSPSAVWAWWSGRNEPGVEALRAYAEAVLVSLSYLLTGAEEPMGPAGTVQEWRLRYAELVRQSVPPHEAIDRITGPALPPEDDHGIPHEEMTQEERALLVAPPGRWRLIDQISPRQWEELTPDQKDAVLRVVQALARANRVPPASPATDADAPEP